MSRVFNAAVAATSFTCVSLLASTAVMAAPSAKFAAVYSSKPMNVVSMISASTAEPATVVDVAELSDTNSGYTFATIKIPQGKEVLVGISAEVGLTTDTSIKGKNGGEARAIAGAHGLVYVVAEEVGGDGSNDKMAKPGEVTLNSRVQELEARLGGVIEECTDGDTDFDGTANNDPDGTIDVATECVVTDEQIALMQDTLSSHHFNLIIPDLVSGTYRIKAYFTTEATGEIQVCDGSGDDSFCEPDSNGDVDTGSVTATTFAKAWIGQYVLTAQ